MVKELTKRVLVAIVGIPVVLGLSYLGGFYFLILILVINGMALWEFYSIYRNRNLAAYRGLGVLLSTGFILIANWYSTQILFAAYLIIVIALLLRHLRVSEEVTSLNTVLTLGGISYITLFLVTLLKLRLQFDQWTALDPGLHDAGKYMVLLWISIWVCDTFAYFGGSLVGRHKLAPRTSPNKTVEGAVFGFIGALVVFVPLGLLWIPELPSVYFWLSATVVGIFGQLGDLIESRFKRDAGVKDTSTLLPGHGGFFDRFDSLIFVSPFLFLIFNYLKF